VALGRSPISGAPIDGGSPVLTVFAWRNQVVDLDLVTRIFREDGTFVEIVNERRGVVKSTRRRDNVLELEVVDVDRSALETLIPSERYTTADFPKLFVDHVGRAVPQMVGDAMKVPLTYIDDTLGAYRYLACKVIGATPTVRTVYRKGAVISASEYVVDTVTVNGITHVRLTFTAEQREKGGSLYDLAADILGPGSRAASDEIQRLLQLVGATTDASSFLSAGLYCLLNGMMVDCPYVSPRQAIGAIQDLLQVARGQLFKTPAGTYGIFIDRPRDVHLALSAPSDELAFEDLLEPEIAKTITLEYRPSLSDQEKYVGKLSRATSGAGAEKVVKNPYVRDHIVADRLLCYLQKREIARRDANATIHAVQLAPGELVAIEAPNAYVGWRTWAAPQVSRPADRNQVTLREYDETVFTYTAGALPADATNVYTPDYSQTLPLAPTGLVVVSQGNSADTDGKVTAYALVRATPPVVNWSRLMVQVEDLTTHEEYQAQLILNAGNYEARISGLRPNRNHQVYAWAVNAFNVDGVPSAQVAFTSSNAVTALSAPTVSVVQVQSFQVDIDLGAVADVAGQPKFRRYVVFEKVGGGSFTEIARTEQRLVSRTSLTHGTTYQYKVRSEDVNGNESTDSNTVSITPSKKVDGGYIVDSSINTTRSYTSTSSASGSLGASTHMNVTTDDYAFNSGLFCTSLFSDLNLETSDNSPTTSGNLGFFNPGGSSRNWEVRWRAFLA
jgi:hypothetical protein